MVRARIGSSKIAALLLLLPFLISCRARPKIVRAPVPAAPDSRIEEYLKEGDAHFLDYHLYGWRQAEAYYKMAYELENSEAIRKKLQLTQFLIMTRQIDEDIICPDLEETVRFLCASPESSQGRELCNIARQYQEGFGATYWQKRAANKEIDRTAFDYDNSVLDAYLYSLCLRTYGIEEPKDLGTPIKERFKDSPLFIYLNVAKKDVRRIKEYEQKYPEFAEMFAFAAADLFQASRFNAARTYFKKAVDLLPDYTRALNGFGDIYFFALEDYEKALEYYEFSLKWDAGNTAALFGKGAVLHHVDKYKESNAALDRMLESDISRKGRAGNHAIRYYKGEANYYKAYNFYLMGERGKAREFIDISKSHLPDSENSNYFSGLLFYEEKKLEEARKDFMKAVQARTSNCNAYYYLGLIDHERNEKNSFQWFLSACSCIEASIRNIEEKIKSLPSLDVEELERLVLKTKFEKRLLGFRHSSATLIEAMIKIVTGAETERAETYLDIMNDLLAHIRVPIPKN